MYKDKDKDKQREADRERQRRYRESHPISSKGRDESVTDNGRDKHGVTKGVTDKESIVTPFVESPGVTKPKRGKDIKCFADLPLDVQQTIDRMSVVDGKIDQTVKANRTAIAINYQHLFPDRFEPQDGRCPTFYDMMESAVCTGKPGDEDYNGFATEKGICYEP